MERVLLHAIRRIRIKLDFGVGSMRALINKLSTIAVTRLGTRAAIVTCPLSRDWEISLFHHVIIARRAICSTQL